MNIETTLIPMQEDRIDFAITKVTNGYLIACSGVLSVVEEDDDAEAEACKIGTAILKLLAEQSK